MENEAAIPTLDASQIIPNGAVTANSISVGTFAPNPASPAGTAPAAPSAAPAPLDLASLVIEDTAVVEIVHPITKKPIGMTVTVYGNDSRVARQVQASQSRARLAKIEAEGKGYTLTSVTPEEREDDALDLLASCTKEWTNAYLNGAYLSCSYDNAVDLYVKLPWLREQIDVAIAERQRFIKG